MSAAALRELLLWAAECFGKRTSNGWILSLGCFEYSALEQKLVRLALDCAASEGEIQNSAVALIRSLQASIILLVHLQRIYQQVQADHPELFKDNDLFIGTTELLGHLNSDKEAPWADWRKGEGLSAEKLKSLLQPFGVASVQKRGEGKRTRGYFVSQFQPLFERYVPCS